MNPSPNTTRKNAIWISALLLFLFLGSLIALLLPQEAPQGYVAEIYQSGVLSQSFSLSEIQKSYTFAIKDENGCINEIEVRPNSIGILSANCPDKLCVKQGFISDSRLPITCLPNKVVIWLRPASDIDTEPDTLTY